MDSIAHKIEFRINSWERGRIFFWDDFADLGSAEAIRQILRRMVHDGKILRVARGIYCYPRLLSSLLGGGWTHPSLDDVAKAVAKRDNLRIIPTGDHALNWLGLSTQVPCNAVYWTDGSARHINIGKGRGILFKHSSSMDNFSYQSELMQLIVLAIREIGDGGMRREDLCRIHELLQTVAVDDFKHDVKLAPLWVQNILMKNYEVC